MFRGPLASSFDLSLGLGEGWAADSCWWTPRTSLEHMGLQKLLDPGPQASDQQLEVADAFSHVLATTQQWRIQRLENNMSTTTLWAGYGNRQNSACTSLQSWSNCMPVLLCFRVACLEMLIFCTQRNVLSHCTVSGALAVLPKRGSGASSSARACLACNRKPDSKEFPNLVY